MRVPIKSPLDILDVFLEHRTEKRIRTALYRIGFGSSFVTSARRSGNMYLDSALTLLDAVGFRLYIDGIPVPSKRDAVAILDRLRTETTQSLSRRAGYDPSHFSKCVKSRSIRLFALLTYVETMGLDIYVEAPDP
jgi:hypothetical protein